MTLSKPIITSTTSADGSLFLSWTYVLDATQYEVELEAKDTGEKTIYFTTSRNFLITKLENERFYSIQVTALNNCERSEPSISYMVRPKLRQSLSVVSAKPAETASRVNLRWTSTSTNCGFLVERCDVGSAKGYKRIAWLPYNTITTYEDETDCGRLHRVCPGHYYTVRFSDSAWSSGAGVLSTKVYCNPPTYSNSDIESDISDISDDNSSEESIEVPLTTSIE